MIDLLRTRIADAVDTLSDLDAWLEARGELLPPLLLAKAAAHLDAIAARLARLRQTLAARAADPSPFSAAADAPEGP